MPVQTSSDVARPVETSSGPSESFEGPPDIAATRTLEDATNPPTDLNEPQTPMPMAYHPIHRLPDELLAAVFQSHYDMTIARFRDRLLDCGGMGAYSWLKIRHVCHLWREIACFSPSLHTHIILADPECVADQLRRSGGLPLSVYATYGYYHLSPQKILESCRLVFQQQPTRICYVLFQWTASLEIALQSPEFAWTELPNLQHLHLLPMSTDRDYTDPLPPFYYPTPFSRMQLPSLRSYCNKSGVSLPHVFETLLHKPLRRTLRCLTYSPTSPPRAASGSGPEVSRPNIFDLLDELPLLEELELQITQEMAMRETNFERRIVLRHLTSLYLCEKGSMGAVTRFLAFLVYPATTHTTVESYLVLHNWLYIASEEAGVIASRFAGNGVADSVPLGDPHFMQLDMSSGMEGVEIGLWNAFTMENIGPVVSEVPLPILTWRIMFSHHPKEVMLHVFLSCILERLPLANVAGMVIVHDDYNEDDCLSLPDVIHTLRHLTGVRVLGTHGMWLVGALAKAMQDDTGDHIFPHLQHWSITGIDQYYAVPKQEAREAMRQVHRQLGTALLHRRKTGARLQFLELETGYMFGMESDEEADVVLSPNIIDDLNRFRWIPRSWGTVPRTSVELMVITNALASMSSAV